MQNKTIAVWFSCGGASAMAAKLVVDKYGKDNNVLIINNPIKEEHEDNLRFKDDISKWIGIPIVEARNENLPSNSAYDLWEKHKVMSMPHFAPCTYYLKKEARYQFECKHEIDFHVLGFTLDEQHRHERFVAYERANVIPVLIDERMTKTMCFDELNMAKIKLPEIYKYIPNANCKGCVKSSSPTYWNIIRKEFKEVFDSRCEQSRRLGAKLVEFKGERIFLDELPKDAKGGKLFSYECGLFCDSY